MEIFNNGGIVIFPTDTAFGIGCRIDKHDSIDRLFNIRKRPLTQAMPVLVDSIKMALDYYDTTTSIMERMMQKYWPGALTIISKAKIDKIYGPIRGGGSTVGLRMPKHPELLDIITALGVPILGPSANFHGLPTPFEYNQLDPSIIELVDYVMPGRCQIKQVSTVMECVNDQISIIRQGAINIQI